MGFNVGQVTNAIFLHWLLFILYRYWLLLYPVLTAVISCIDCCFILYWLLLYPVLTAVIYPVLTAVIYPVLAAVISCIDCCYILLTAVTRYIDCFYCFLYWLCVCYRDVDDSLVMVDAATGESKVVVPGNIMREPRVFRWDHWRRIKTEENAKVVKLLGGRID